MAGRLAWAGTRSGLAIPFSHFRCWPGVVGLSSIIYVVSRCRDEMLIIVSLVSRLAAYIDPQLHTRLAELCVAPARLPL